MIKFNFLSDRKENKSEKVLIMLTPSRRKYLTLILIVVIFYIIVTLLIATLGYDYIVALWSFPLLIISIILFLKRGKVKLAAETSYLLRFIIANLILVSALIAAFFTAYYSRSRSLTIVVALTVWLALSIVFIGLIKRNGANKEKII